jgi:hypothetical protein
VYYKTKQDIFAPRVGEVTMHEGTGLGYHAGLDASIGRRHRDLGAAGDLRQAAVRQGRVSSLTLWTLD